MRPIFAPVKKNVQPSAEKMIPFIKLKKKNLQTICAPNANFELLPPKVERTSEGKSLGPKGRLLAAPNPDVTQESNQTAIGQLVGQLTVHWAMGMKYFFNGQRKWTLSDRICFTTCGSKVKGQRSKFRFWTEITPIASQVANLIRSFRYFWTSDT